MRMWHDNSIQSPTYRLKLYRKCCLWQKYGEITFQMRHILREKQFLYLMLMPMPRCWCHSFKMAYPYCVKSVRIRSYSGANFPAFGVNMERYWICLSPYSVRMWENADQNNFEYGHFLRSLSLSKFSIITFFLLFILIIEQTTTTKFDNFFLALIFSKLHSITCDNNFIITWKTHFSGIKYI